MTVRARVQRLPHLAQSEPRPDHDLPGLLMKDDQKTRLADQLIAMAEPRGVPRWTESLRISEQQLGAGGGHWGRHQRGRGACAPWQEREARKDPRMGLGSSTPASGFDAQGVGKHRSGLLGMNRSERSAYAQPGVTWPRGQMPRSVPC